jgi:soluble lytic murein transglycosylase-like protein
MPSREAGNNLIRFCSILLLVAGLGSAADNWQRQGVTSVVRPDLRTGRLVRSVIITAKPIAARPVAATVVEPRTVGSVTPEAASSARDLPGIDEAVERIAAQHDLSPQLLHSVIKVESNYNPFAVSSKGALGLMQLVPSTASRFGVADVFNPVENIQGGARYLRYLLDLYHGNYPLALAAYNAGEAAVARYGGVPPYRETQNYVVQVRKQLEKANKPAPVKPAPAAPKPLSEEAKSAGPAHIVEVVEPDGSVRYVSQ